MAHFAKLDDQNYVTEVIVISNQECLDQYGNENEAIGALFCHNLLGGIWLQTSYSGAFRGCYAGIGYWYDAANDVFVPPQEEPTE